MGQQQIEQVARRPVCGLQTGGQQQPQERDDRLVGELLAVDLRGTQVADDVLGRLLASLLNLVEEVAVQLVRRGQSSRDVGRNRDQVEGESPEHVEIFARQSE